MDEKNTQEEMHSEKKWDKVSLYRPGLPETAEMSACVCLLSVGIKGMHHHTQTQ